MLRCPEVPRIRNPAGKAVDPGFNGPHVHNGYQNRSTASTASGEIHTISSSTAFDTSGNDGRRPQTRAERDGQSTDSGISDLSDKEDDYTKHLSPNLISKGSVAATTRACPPNAMVLPNGAVLSNSQNVGAPRATSSVVVQGRQSQQPPIVTVCDSVGKSSDTDGPQIDSGKTKTTILNPPSGVHGPGKFRSDPKIDSKYIGVDGVDNEPLDLTGNREMKKASQNISSFPPAAHQHPFLASHLTQNHAPAISFLIEKYAPNSSVGSSAVSNPGVNSHSMGNSRPLSQSPRMDGQPTRQNGEIHERFKPGSGLKPPPPPINGLAYTGDKRSEDSLPPSVIVHQPHTAASTPGQGMAQFHPRGTESIPLTATAMQQQDPRKLNCQQVPTQTTNAVQPQQIARTHPNNAVASHMPIAMSNGWVAPSELPHRNISHPMNVTVPPPRMSSTCESTPFPTNGQIRASVPHTAAPELRNQPQQAAAGFVNGYPPMMNFFPPPPFQQVRPFLPSNQFQYFPRPPGINANNYQPNRFPTCAMNQQMVPTSVPLYPQTVHEQTVPQGKPKRKYTRRRHNDEVVTSIIENIKNETFQNGQQPMQVMDNSLESRMVFRPAEQPQTYAVNTNRTNADCPPSSSTTYGFPQSVPHMNICTVQNPAVSRIPPVSELPSRVPSPKQPDRKNMSIPTSKTDVSVRPFVESQETVKNSVQQTCRVSAKGDSTCSRTCYEGLGNKLENQSYANATIPAGQNIRNETDVRLNDGCPKPSTDSEENIKKISVHPQEISVSPTAAGSGEAKPNDVARTDSQALPVGSNRQTSSPNDTSSSYHRNLPKKRHLFQKQLSDSSIPSLYEINPPKDTVIEPVKQPHAEQSKACLQPPVDLKEVPMPPSNPKEQMTAKVLEEPPCRIETQTILSETGDKERVNVGATEQPHCRSGHQAIPSGAADKERVNFGTTERPPYRIETEAISPVPGAKVQQRQVNETSTVNLNLPQLQDSSQNQKRLPGLINYRFGTPTPRQTQQYPGQIAQRPMEWVNRPWRPRMPYHAPLRQQNPVQMPGNMPPRFDVKEKLANFLVHKQSSENDDPKTPRQIGNDPTRVANPQPMQTCPVRQAQPQKQTVLLVHGTPVGQVYLQQPPQHIRSGTNTKAIQPPIPPGSILMPLTPMSVGPTGVGITLPVVSMGSAIPPKPAKDITPTRAKDNIISEKEIIVQPTDKTSGGNIEAIVMNTKKMSGIEGVVLNVNEETFIGVNPKNKRGQKRNAAEATIVPENVFVRAKERRKRLELLPTPEALAFGEATNETLHNPKSLLSLAASTFARIQHSELISKRTGSNFRKNTEHLAGDMTDTKESGCAPLMNSRREDVTETMIASLINDACAERDHRKFKDYNDTISLPQPSNSAPDRRGINATLKRLRDEDGQHEGSSQPPPRPVLWMYIPKDEVTPSTPKLEKQKLHADDTGKKHKENNVRHYRPKGMLPKSRKYNFNISREASADLEGKELRPVEVINEGSTEEQGANPVCTDDIIIQDVIGGAEDIFPPSPMGSVDVPTKLQEPVSGEKECPMETEVDYEALLHDVHHPKAPSVVNEILDEMDFELRSSLPEVECRSSDESSESEPESEVVDEVHFGTVHLDGKEYRMRIVVDENDSSSESDCEIEGSQDSESESETSMTSSLPSLDNWCVDEGVDMFQDFEMLDDDDDVFVDDEESDSDGSSGKTDADPESEEENVPGFTTEDLIQDEIHPFKDDINKKQTDGVNEEVGVRQPGTTESDDVYIIDDFSYVDERGNRQWAIREDKITEVIEIDPSITHQVDIELVTYPKITDAPKYAETLFEKFGMGGFHSDENSYDDDEGSPVYLGLETNATESDEKENHRQLICPVSNAIESESAQRDLVLDVWAAGDRVRSPLPASENDRMPMLISCSEEDLPPPLLRLSGESPPRMLSPSEEPPVLQYLGRSDGVKQFPQPEYHDFKSRSIKLGIRRISRRQSRKRRKLKMISLSPKSAGLADKIEKENNDLCGTVAYKWRTGVTTPENKRFLPNSVRFGTTSEVIGDSKDHKKPSTVSENCEFRSLCPSYIRDEKYRPFSPINWANPYSQLTGSIVPEYCCKCRKNGKLKSPNRLHSRDEICPYYAFTSRFDDTNYCSSGDELSDPSDGQNNPISASKTETERIAPTRCESPPICTSIVSNDDKHDPPPTSVAVDQHAPGSTENGKEDNGCNAPDNIDDDFPSTEDVYPRPCESPLVEEDGVQLPTTASATNSETDSDVLLNHFEVSSETSESVFCDENGCDDILFSSCETVNFASDSLSTIADTESDCTLIDSCPAEPITAISKNEPTSTLGLPKGDRKCWVELCDIGACLQGKTRIHIRDFMTYNESLCEIPAWSLPADIPQTRGAKANAEKETPVVHVDQAAMQHRIEQLKNKLKEVQQEMALKRISSYKS